MNRRRFLMRTGCTALGLAGAPLVMGRLNDGALFDEQGQRAGPPDGSQSRGMITRAAQEAIDGGLAYLAAQQHGDGSFGTAQHRGSVAITSLSGLAFMAGGRQPGGGGFCGAVNR